MDLDNPDSAHRGYVARVSERVRAHVVYPRGAGERGIGGELQVEFRIGREGRVECVALRRSCRLRSCRRRYWRARRFRFRAEDGPASR